MDPKCSSRRSFLIRDILGIGGSVHEIDAIANNNGDVPVNLVNRAPKIASNNDEEQSMCAYFDNCADDERHLQVQQGGVHFDANSIYKILANRFMLSNDHHLTREPLVNFSLPANNSTNRLWQPSSNIDNSKDQPISLVYSADSKSPGTRKRSNNSSCVIINNKNKKNIGSDGSGKEKSTIKRSNTIDECSDSICTSIMSDEQQSRRNRTIFCEYQLIGLEQRFDSHKYLTTGDRIKIARLLNLNQLQVKTWYQNRRMKWKKQVMMEGSQVSPTKPKGRPRKDSIPCIEDLDN